MEGSSDIRGCPEWAYMSSLTPPVYPCLRRPNIGSTGQRMALNGRLDKAEWANAVWTDSFVDIEGPLRKPNPSMRTRVKMMWDDEYLYVGAEMEDTRVWGTFTVKNTTMYHENDFEIFIDPDGSRHNYYEFEMNCLNTIWELVLHRPYKDGHSIENPSNLSDIHSAVHIDGAPNDPSVICKQWSVEVAIPLREMVQFDRMRNRVTQVGDVWRMNFSRVHYDLNIENDPITQRPKYTKVPNRREYNIVWAPTGVIDIHRPEKWAFVAFLGTASAERATCLQLQERLHAECAWEDVLNTIYYDQRHFFSQNQLYAASLEDLYHPIPTLLSALQQAVHLNLECAVDRQAYKVSMIVEGTVRSMHHDAKYEAT